MTQLDASKVSSIAAHVTVFNTAAVAASSLYQATGSAPVTIAATAAAALVAGWATWLDHRKPRPAATIVTQNLFE